MTGKSVVCPPLSQRECCYSDWSLLDAGLDENTHINMGQEWSEFAEKMLACLDLVDKIPMQKNGWEGQHADQKLVQVMQPWLNAQPLQASVPTSCPDDFCVLWTNHIRSKMFYKLLGATDGVKVFEEVRKRKFWCGGRHGLIIIAVGLKWVYSKVKKRLLCNRACGGMDKVGKGGDYRPAEGGRSV